MTGWADKFTGRLFSLEGCVICDKPTQSHLLLLVYDAEMDAIEALDPDGHVAPLATADAYGTVCHSCYTDADGDADAVAAAYDERLDELLSSADTTAKIDGAWKELVDGQTRKRNLLDGNLDIDDH